MRVKAISVLGSLTLPDFLVGSMLNPCALTMVNIETALSLVLHNFQTVWPFQDMIPVPIQIHSPIF